MAEHGFDVLTASADGKEVVHLQNAGIRHEVVEMTRTISPLKDLKALVKLIRLMKRFKPDIVHTHTPKAGLLGMMAARIAGVPVRMHTVAGLPQMEAEGVKKSLLKLTEWITCFCAQRVYPNSFGLLRYLNDYLPSFRSKFRVLGNGSTNGIDTSYFSANAALGEKAKALRHKYNVQDDELVYCFIGRIVSDKGINELLSAFEEISRTRRAKLFLVGMLENELDPLTSKSLAIIRDHPNVISLGYLDDVRLPLLASDVFVFPSYREGFPNVVMQAMCMGVPCIVSDINGCNELVEDGRTGLIIPVKDTEALKTAMLNMMEKEDERLCFAKRALENVRKNYEQQHVWELLLEEYRSLSSHLR
jgi:glycosyltransferase involved in cell wall biosynthesis